MEVRPGAAVHEKSLEERKALQIFRRRTVSTQVSIWRGYCDRKKFGAKNIRGGGGELFAEAERLIIRGPCLHMKRVKQREVLGRTKKR